MGIAHMAVLAIFILAIVFLLIESYVGNRGALGMAIFLAIVSTVLAKSWRQKTKQVAPVDADMKKPFIAKVPQSNEKRRVWFGLGVVFFSIGLIDYVYPVSNPNAGVLRGITGPIYYWLGNAGVGVFWAILGIACLVFGLAEKKRL